MRIGIIGKGNVGTALGKGLLRSGHEIKYGHRDLVENVKDAASWGEVIILAVPYSAVNDAVKEIGSFADGKALVDVTNVLGPNWDLAIGFSTSGAEELQRQLPKAKIVKAFNTVFAQNQSTGRIGSERLTAFLASDDPNAKQVVAKLASDIGFDPIDVGSLKAARYLEPMGVMMIGLGITLKMGKDIGYKLVRG